MRLQFRTHLRPVDSGTSLCGKRVGFERPRRAMPFCHKCVRIATETYESWHIVNPKWKKPPKVVGAVGTSSNTLSIRWTGMSVRPLGGEDAA